MEQYQNTVIIDRPPQGKAPVKLQLTALILGIVGMALALTCYFLVFFTNVVHLAADDGVVPGSLNIVLAALSLIAMLIGTAAIILGAVGLVRSIRRKTRTVKGIAFSGVGVCLGGIAVAFAFISVFLAGIFSLVIRGLH